MNLPGGSTTISGGIKGVHIFDKVDASGPCKIDGGTDGGVIVGGKVHSSGYIQLRGNVYVGGELSCSGKVSIINVKPGQGGKMGTVKVGGKIGGSSGCSLEGDVVFE